MNFEDLKVGQRFVCVRAAYPYDGKIGRIVTFTVFKNSASVIYGGMINVEWEDGYPNGKVWSSPSTFLPLPPLEYEAAYVVESQQAPVEEPCTTCGRKCFVTDTKCWWCERSNPTQARST